MTIILNELSMLKTEIS